MLLRYRALKTANTDLAATLQGLTQSCEEGRAQLGNFKKERGNVNLGATNAIAGLQRKIEAVQGATRQRVKKQTMKEREGGGEVRAEHSPYLLSTSVSTVHSFFKKSASSSISCVHSVLSILCSHALSPI